MKEEHITLLAQLLTDNLGSKLTPSLANGIIYTLVQETKKVIEDEV